MSAYMTQCVAHRWISVGWDTSSLFTKKTTTQQSFVCGGDKEVKLT